MNDDYDMFLESYFMVCEKFDIKDLSDEEVDDFYDVYKTSYEKETGSSWSKDKFLRRAKDWTFYGDTKGGVALRWQPRAKLYKFVATYGSPIRVAKALKKMKAEIGSEGIWGAMSLKLAHMLEKGTGRDFKVPPPLLVKKLVPLISNSFGGNIGKIDADGGITIDMPGIGTTKKYFIANKNYYKWLLDKGMDQLNLPTIVKAPITFLLGKLI